MDYRDIIKKFLAEWPVERVRTMSLSDYSSVGTNSSFCYWLESITEKVGSIWGGSSFKFGIYERNDKKQRENAGGLSYSERYAWYTKYGLTPEEAFEKVKSIIILIIESAMNSDLRGIDAIDFSPAYKWKIAFLYQNHKELQILPIYKLQMLRFLSFASSTANKSYLECYAKLLEQKDNYDAFDYSEQLWNKWNQYNKSVTGLVASDGDDWKSDALTEIQSNGLYVLWWSKPPSKGQDVLTQLESIIESNDSFPLYILNGGYAEYLFRVVDFAVEDNYNEKTNKWQVDVPDSISDYSDGSKSAKIVFLVDRIDKVTSQISAEDFIYWDGAQKPRHDNLQPFVSITLVNSNGSNRDNLRDSTGIKQFTLNTILYGPPGTGKTFQLIPEALRIIDGDSFLNDRKGSVERFKELVKDNRIVFTTFHQSYSYEEFVEGIKPNSNNKGISYSVQPGIFKTLCLDAESAFDLERIRYTADNIDEILPFSTVLTNQDYPVCYFRKKEKAAIWQKFKIDSENNEKIAEDGSLTENIDIVAGRVFFEKREICSYRITAYKGNSDTRFLPKDIEFKKKFLRENSLTALRFIDETNVEVIIKQVTNESLKTQTIPYVLIIDEINRGNISKIFGELITLIEEDKRLGAENELKVTLPYSRESFGVPKNLYIIGTMNTADRSIALMDTALRRRFSFKEIMPNHTILKEDIDGISLQRLLEVMNQRIEYLYDRDHTIGHAYLMGIDSLNALAEIFKNKILPLLQEYFYDDWQKIKAVLNDDSKNAAPFIIVENQSLKKSLFSNDFSERIDEDVKIYRVNEEGFEIKENYIHIYDSNNGNQ